MTAALPLVTCHLSKVTHVTHANQVWNLMQYPYDPGILPSSAN